MQLVYTSEQFPNQVTRSIFLAGPTPRDQNTPSWRKQALEILELMGYDGVVFIPEARDGCYNWSYQEQVNWEDEGLNRADCILFWIPRDLVTLPGFTTNHEHGEWFKSGKVVLGTPVDAPKNRYLEMKAEDAHVPQRKTLRETVEKAIQMVGDGASRVGGECQVPLFVWQTASFQGWYRAQRAAGNSLHGARLEWTYRVGPAKKIVFLWVLKVNVRVESEGRNKVNEFVLARPDISSVVMYKRASTIDEVIVVLVREFRSPTSSKDGYVWEVPGGSSFKPETDVFTQASAEVYEETGLKINAERLKEHGTRQILATLSAHKAHVFSVELTAQEIDLLREEAGVAHGIAEDSERTYVELRTVREILQEQLVDWSNLGMILSVLS